ncbi:MAG TPA: hypothetical protein VNP89_06110 [Gaiellaceae bacterium]|nr:hypothetical protein [Gaiellaceae bacterium]
MKLGACCLLALLLAGCSAGGEDTSTAQVRVVIPDNNIREEGVECAGARPFRQIRRGTTFTVEAAEGEVVAEGELPAGRAENADPNIDWGVERIPTVCVMELELDLPERPRYRFVLPDAVPLEFDRALLDGDEPLELVLSG